MGQDAGDCGVLSVEAMLCEVKTPPGKVTAFDEGLKYYVYFFY